MDRRLFRVKVQQVKMMERRGFDISRERPLLDWTYEQFAQFYTDYANTTGISVRQALMGLYQREGELALVAFVENTAKTRQLGVEPVRGFISLFTQNHCTQGILISQQPLSKDAGDELNATTVNFVQHFLESELAYNVLEHYLQPKFEVIPEAETARFLEEQKLVPAKMPIIKATDPISKYLGLTKGTIVREIHRNLSGETLVDSYVTFSVIG